MRIRSIKPEFWRSDDIAELDIFTRLLFIGLWSYVDDCGRGRDNVQLIVSDLFPLDDPRESVANVREGLARLLALGLITRYEVSGRPFLHITSWTRHQRVDKARDSLYPAPDDPLSQVTAIRESVANVREEVATPREDVAPGAGSREQGAGSRDAAPQAVAVPPERPTRGSRIPGDFTVTPGMVEWAKDNAAGVNVHTATASFVDYWTSVPGQRGVKLDWVATWRTWMRKDAERVQPRRGSYGPKIIRGRVGQMAMEE